MDSQVGSVPIVNIVDRVMTFGVFRSLRHGTVISPWDPLPGPRGLPGQR